MQQPPSLRSHLVRFTTSVKLDLLRKEKSTLTACRHSICSESSSLSVDIKNPAIAAASRSRTQATLMEALRLTDSTSVNESAKGALSFLEMHEPGYPSLEEMKSWSDHLEKEMDQLERRADHFVVFGDVLQEWLVEEDKQGKEDSEYDLVDSEPNMEFAPFPPTAFDPSQYLTENNINNDLLASIERVRTNVSQFGKTLLSSTYTITPADVSLAMDTLSKDARIFAPSIREQLRELKTQDSVVNELASTFTTTWRNLSRWDWPQQGVKKVLQKHMSGKVRMFLDLDIDLAIFLQLVGQVWSSYFHSELSDLRRSKGWPKVFELQELRTGEEGKIKMMLELLRSAVQSQDDYGEMDADGDLDGPVGPGISESACSRLQNDFVKIIKPHTPGGRSEGYEEPNDDSTTHGWGANIEAVRSAETYSRIFRSLTTDMALAKTVAPDLDMGVLHADLKDFGASVPHEVSLQVIRFFGMPPIWMNWFKSYLQLPTIDTNGNVSRLSRGTPFGLSPSSLINELLLVLLDIAVVCKSGVAMHRNHDDFWIWSVKTETMGSAWEVMRDFTKRTGMEWNMEKSGYTVVRGKDSKNVVDENLPKASLKWGLLELQEDGSWKGNDQLVKEQAESMLKELSDLTSSSFLSKVNLWNKYQAYIARNIGAPTTITGLSHDSLHRQFKIHFPQHFDYRLNPAIFAWPLSLGGFQLHEHGLHAILYHRKIPKATSTSKSMGIFKQEAESARLRYERLLRAWDSELGERAWNLGGLNRDAHISNWVQSNSEKPPFVAESTFLRWVALIGNEWQRAYETGQENLGLEADEMAAMAKTVYGPFVVQGFGHGCDELVPQGLIPHHAVAEVSATTKKLFSSGV